MDRYALSRNEEEKILKALKAQSLKVCEVPVTAFTSCAEGRTISVAWSCREPFKAMQECMKAYMTEQRLDQAKIQYLKDGKFADPGQRDTYR